MNTKTFAFLWIALFTLGGILETFTLIVNPDWTLSRTLRRAFAHAPWLTVIAFFVFVGWFTIHIWAPLFVHVAKSATKATYHVALKLTGKGAP